MSEKNTAPFGSWESPLAASVVAKSALAMGSPRVHGEDVYWWEMRPAEDGRCVVVRRDASGRQTALPQPYSARSLVHEYGGRSFDCLGSTIFFTNFDDQAIYAWEADGSIRPITPANNKRYCDMAIDRKRRRILAVVEEHQPSGVIENRISAIDIATGDEHVIAAGNDFYAAPRLSPDGMQLAWITWNQPSMPWDVTELWVTRLEESGAVATQRRISGDEGDRALCEPTWSPVGDLYVVSDHTNWWNLYMVEQEALVPVAPMDAECTVPLWWMGVSQYTFVNDLVVLSAARDAVSSLYVFRPGESPRALELPFTDIGSLFPRGRSHVLARCAGPIHPPTMVSIDLNSGAWEALSNRVPLPLEVEDVSPGLPVSGPTRNGVRTHGFLYRPRNHSVDPPDAPFPLIVRAHGGPTEHTTSAFDAWVQFWTTRGFGFLDVNYGGSTGFGRAYRLSLHGNLGLLDNTDCIDLALDLARQGIADRDKLFITGGSAGGYVVLCCMAYHPDVFTAGTSYFGIADLELLAQEEDHKFESRYLERLVGSKPSETAVFRERSPRYYAHQISRPVLLLQGMEDKIVPPQQAEMMVAALRANRVPCAYIAFAGEQHGFRQEPNITRALEAELSFYQQILGVPHSPDVPLIEIQGLGARVGL